MQDKGSISPSTFRPTTAHYIRSHGSSRPPAGKYSKAMANSDWSSTSSSAEETAHMKASQYCAFTREEGIKATEATHQAQLEASHPQLPLCTWCGDETGHYCDGWRPPIQRLRDAFATEVPGAEHACTHHLAAWWGCGMPLCPSCDNAMHGCIDCFCRKGGVSLRDAASTHFFCMSMPRGQGDVCSGPPGLSF